MKVIKLHSIQSTQDYLKKIVEENKSTQTLLVYAISQTQGVGRHGKVWQHLPGSLACSFTLKPHPQVTLSSLEVALIIQKYLLSEFSISIQLKWPNDLFFHGKKCGGIIINLLNNVLIVGLGLNTHQEQDTAHLEEVSSLPIKNINPDHLYQYILDKHPLSANQVLSQWTQACFHLNKTVRINGTKGIFRGVGKMGEAILVDEKTGEIRKFLSGTLRLN